MAQQQSQGPEKAKPVHVIRIGALSASVWENQGRDGKWWSVSYQRGYMDSKGVWQYSTHFNFEDTLALSQLAVRSFNYLELLRATQRKAARDAKSAAGGTPPPLPQQPQQPANGATQPQQPVQQSFNSGEYQQYDEVPY